MQKINLLDFSKMRVDISRIGEGQSFLEVFPAFQHLKAYIVATEEEIRVAILLCDRYGPFSTIKNFEERLKAIFSHYNWFINDKPAPLYLDLYEQVLHLKNDHVADIWTEYLPAVFDHEWTSWFSNSVMYYQIMREMRKPIEITLDGESDKESEARWSKRLKIEQKADEIYKKMKSMEAIIFNDEQVKRRSHEREQEKKIETYPEKFAMSSSVA